MHFLVEFEPSSQRLRSFSRFGSHEEARRACEARISHPLPAERLRRVEPSYYQILDEQQWERYLQRQG